MNQIQDLRMYVPFHPTDNDARVVVFIRKEGDKYLLTIEGDTEGQMLFREMLAQLELQPIRESPLPPDQWTAAMWKKEALRFEQMMCEAMDQCGKVAKERDMWQAREQVAELEAKARELERDALRDSVFVTNAQYERDMWKARAEASEANRDKWKHRCNELADENVHMKQDKERLDWLDADVEKHGSLPKGLTLRQHTDNRMAEDAKWDDPDYCGEED